MPASLGNDSAYDPNILSIPNLAVIPDMISVTSTTIVLYDDTNLRVENPEEFFNPLGRRELDWTEDEKYITLDEWEGFAVIDESATPGYKDTPWAKDGLRWALYFDIDDNGLKGKRGKRKMFEVTLERRCQSAEDQLKQLEDAEEAAVLEARVAA